MKCLTRVGESLVNRTGQGAVSKADPNTRQPDGLTGAGSTAIGARVMRVARVIRR